jgi:hypothetical protein
MTREVESHDVHITHHNEGFSVVYSSGQRALRSTFENQQAAVDAVDNWNKVGDFQMKLSPEVIDHRYDVDEERAKMGLKPLAEDRDGQYFVDQIMALKALGSPHGKSLDDVSKLDLDGSDAKQILRLANEGLTFVGPADAFFETLKAISAAGEGRSVFDSRDAKKMLALCQEGVDEQRLAAPAIR